MLLKILGWFWIIMGVLFLFQPEKLRNRLKKKGVKKIKKFSFWIILILSILLIKAAWGMSGPLSILIIVVGLIGIFKSIYFLKAKAADKLIEWFIAQPVKFFRMWAVGLILFGAFLLTVH